MIEISVAPNKRSQQVSRTSAGDVADALRYIQCANALRCPRRLMIHLWRSAIRLESCRSVVLRQSPLVCENDTIHNLHQHRRPRRKPVGGSFRP
jgi:hypothetical protein